MKLQRTVLLGGASALEGTWIALSASQQKEMDGAIVMFQEAMDQVSGRG